MQSGWYCSNKLTLPILLNFSHFSQSGFKASDNVVQKLTYHPSRCFHLYCKYFIQSDHLSCFTAHPGSVSDIFTLKKKAIVVIFIAVVDNNVVLVIILFSQSYSLSNFRKGSFCCAHQFAHSLVNLHHVSDGPINIYFHFYDIVATIFLLHQTWKKQNYEIA